jgi:hypothetical protein
MVLQKFSQEDYDKWTDFKAANGKSINRKEQELIAKLHSIYYKHSYYLPCTCSPKTYIAWIKQLNDIYANGTQ